MATNLAVALKDAKPSIPISQVSDHPVFRLFHMCYSFLIKASAGIFRATTKSTQILSTKVIHIVDK